MRVLYCAIVVLLIFSSKCYSSDAIIIEKPEQAFLCLYTSIFDLNTITCDGYFYDEKSFINILNSTENNNYKSVVDYLKTKRSAFEYRYSTPENVLSRGSISYIFNSVNKGGLFTERPLSVSMSLPLYEGGKKSIVKEITLDLVKSDSLAGHKYLIKPATIRINGIYLLNFDLVERNFDFLKELGVLGNKRENP